MKNIGVVVSGFLEPGLQLFAAQAANVEQNIWQVEERVPRLGWKQTLSCRGVETACYRIKVLWQGRGQSSQPCDMECLLVLLLWGLPQIWASSEGEWSKDTWA